MPAGGNLPLYHTMCGRSLERVEVWPQKFNHPTEGGLNFLVAKLLPTAVYVTL